MCYVPEDSETAGNLYAYRAHVFYELKLYQKCLDDIEYAKSHKCPSKKLAKLEELKKTIESDRKVDDKSAKQKEAEFLGKTIPGNPKYPGSYVANFLEVKRNSQYGRYVVTNADLKVGTVIIEEKPFSAILIPAERFKRCENCLQSNSLSLIPCKNCSDVMYCSETCREIAYTKFHKFECGMVKILDDMFDYRNHFALKIFFESLDKFQSLDQFKSAWNSMESNGNASILDFDGMDPESSKFNMLKAVKALGCDRPIEIIYHKINVGVAIVNFMLENSLELKKVLSSSADDIEFFKTFVCRQILISNTNGFEIYGNKQHKEKCGIDEENDIGNAIYPFGSLLNHSCAPNILRLNKGNALLIVVCRHIKKGEQIFDSYG